VNLIPPPEIPGRLVEAIVTVYAPVVGSNRPGRMTLEVFPATVRTRLIYKGCPAFLANDPEAVKP
jgi:hypothetical protein